jgi:ferritin-like metal-binding protein YciE
MVKGGANMARGRANYETLNDLLLLKLRSLLDIETQQEKVLPKMAKSAREEKLREAFTLHLRATVKQKERLERALHMLGATGKDKSKVEAVRGLVNDVDWIIKSVKNPAARDVMLIAAAQYIEHYELAGYGTARTWAEVMGHDDIADTLQQSLDEEGEADKRLTILAIGDGRSGINETIDFGMPS